MKATSTIKKETKMVPKEVDVRVVTLELTPEEALKLLYLTCYSHTISSALEHTANGLVGFQGRDGLEEFIKTVNISLNDARPF